LPRARRHRKRFLLRGQFNRLSALCRHDLVTVQLFLLLLLLLLRLLLLCRLMLDSKLLLLLLLLQSLLRLRLL
jgi:hypothetical protein